MYLPFCTGKRPGKGRREANAGYPIPWTPSPYGQLESERLIAGDTSAVSDLSSLITRAGATSARVPHLNSSGVVATSELLRGHFEDGASLLADERAAAERRSQTARPWTFGSLFFSNASLIGEDFQQSLTGLCGQGNRESVRIQNSVPQIRPCRGHWQWSLVYCSYQDCSVYHKPSEHPQSRPCTAGDAKRLSERPVSIPSPTEQRVSLTSSLEEELDAQETEDEGEDFPFDAHLQDEGEYERVLCEATAVAARSGSPKLVSVRRKHVVGDAEPVGAALNLEAQPTEEPRWSTQAQTGCPEACTEAPRKQRSLRLSRLSLNGPPSGPPSVPLPPNPPSSTDSLRRRFSK